MPKTFSKAALEELAKSRMLGIRSGKEHRFLGIWVVVVKRRVFVRSWNDKTTGWYRAFLNEPRGEIQVGKRTIPVRAKPVRSEKLIDAIDDAYAAKYNTPASMKWVRGFRKEFRRKTTTEFLPR